MEKKNSSNSGTGKKKMSRNTKIAIGVGAGLAAAAATAAGVYFFTGNKGAQNRRKVKSWMMKAKADVMEQMEKLKTINEDVYNQIIDKVANRYRGLKNVDKAELAAIVSELRGHWRSISGQLKQARGNGGGARKKGGAKKKGSRARTK